MKVYVDELPKSCRDCFCNVEDTWCALSDGEMGDICEEYDNKTRHKKCPLQSIADYTKQVRKEVCEKFVEQFILEYTMGNEPVEDIIYKVTNQIQGDKIE